MNPMIILGLGTNTGDRFNNLRKALAALRNIPNLTLLHASALYYSQAQLLPLAPTEWNEPFINMAVACQTTLSPEDLLNEIKQVEATLGRTKHLPWSPRTIDIDILAWGDLCYESNTLTLPHKELLHRPFALWPLLDLLPSWEHPKKRINITTWGDRKNRKSPFHTHQIPHRLEKPSLVGILNITPDSFSDGGLFTCVEKSLPHIEALFYAGAEIIDVGAESTRPGAQLLTPHEEWERLHPFLEAFSQRWSSTSFKPRLSLDTRHPEIAEKASDYHLVEWINDVSGEASEDFAKRLSGTSLQYILMHSLSVPANPHHILNDNEVVNEVYQFGLTKSEQLQTWGLKKEQLIFDVGIGFGKSAKGSLALLQHIEKFHSLHVPLLIGHSRKSFLKLFTDQLPEQRDLETAVFSALLAKSGVDYLRVHNVEINNQMLQQLDQVPRVRKLLN